MRTTITLEPDTEAAIRRLMRRRGISFKAAVNEAIRAGLVRPPAEPKQFTFPKPMGMPLIDVDKASHFAAQLEDEEIMRKLELRK